MPHPVDGARIDRESVAGADDAVTGQMTANRPACLLVHRHLLLLLSTVQAHACSIRYVTE